jgi:hypothetical protein
VLDSPSRYKNKQTPLEKFSKGLFNKNPDAKLLPLYPQK